MTNPAFVKRAGRFDGATAFLREAGFEDDGPDHMRLGGAGDVGGEGDGEVLARLRRGRDALAAYGRERGAVPPVKPATVAPGGGGDAIVRSTEGGTAKVNPKAEKEPAKGEAANAAPTKANEATKAETAKGAASGAEGGTAKAATNVEREAQAENATGGPSGAAPTSQAVDMAAEAAEAKAAAVERERAARIAEEERAAAEARARAEAQIAEADRRQDM